MKIILVGYLGSQRIVPASQWLVSKYLSMFEAIYLNYKGPIEGWAGYVATFLKFLTDEYVVFTLDDYLVADYIDLAEMRKGFSRIGGDTVCIKLCNSTDQEHREYPVTTQYCLWNREYLISLLEKVRTPWEFEIIGSKIFDKECEHWPCIKYFTNSSLSARWEGVNLEGLKEEDLTYIKENGLIS